MKYSIFKSLFLIIYYHHLNVVINNKWRRSLKDVHTCKGTYAYAGCDHYFVMSMLKLCLRKAPAKKNRSR